MIEWEDITSYAQNDKERIPKSIRTEINNIDITIHRHVNYNEELFITSNSLHMRGWSLKTNDYEEAKNNALTFVKQYLENIIDMYVGVISEIFQDSNMKMIERENNYEETKYILDN